MPTKLTAHSVQMSTPQKTVLRLPQNEEIQEATAKPILLPSLDHALQQGPLLGTRRLSSPTSPPTPPRPKKLKMQSPGDMFPSNWSPPPIEFLRVLQTDREDATQRQVGAASLQKLRSSYKDLEHELDSDSKGSTDSLSMLWNRTGPRRLAEVNNHTQLTCEGSEKYMNNLDFLLQEKREQALEQEREKQLLQNCLNLDSLALKEDQVPLKPEHRMLVEKFSVSLQVIPSVPPGEKVFLSRHYPLPCALDTSNMEPHNHLEGLFLSSPPFQQLSFLHSGLLSNLYLHRSDCPVPLLRWLFQLLTWPPETSSRAFDLLWDLSVDGLFCQSDEDMHLWCPSLQEITEVFRSLGADSPALYPMEPYQHSDQVPESEANLSWQVDPPQEATWDISLSYIHKFVTLCALAKPGAYTDGSLLGLIELLCRAGLDMRLCLQPKTDLQQLLLLLLENIQDWPGKLQQLCSSLSWVSDHHHNLLALVQLFLDVTSRSRQLRSQLSLTVIARMLGKQEMLPVWQEKTQLSLLSRLLSLMRPSSLRQHLGSEPLPPCQEQQPKTNAELDHKVCYLCHSLLTLAGVVVSSQDITPNQWGELQLLCMQLDRHISTHIRESPQAMHRTNLKDLATQTYIRWQELLAHCQPQAQYFSPWKDT
ncbi:protein FAM178B [Ochotona curzoniae]|uniref:protein FAM178B n=1 Tax=Ochotona curzoniae TaxID=130825 RepID=UPI001B3499F9|nr:protein FAM178B [Ochotona curzoniae]